MDTTKMPSAVRLNLELAGKADVLAAELAARKTDLDPQIAALKEQMAPLAATLADLEAAHVKAHKAEQDALANAAMHRRMVASEGWGADPVPPAQSPPVQCAHCGSPIHRAPLATKWTHTDSGQYACRPDADASPWAEPWSEVPAQSDLSATRPEHAEVPAHG